MVADLTQNAPPPPTQAPPPTAAPTQAPPPGPTPDPNIPVAVIPTAAPGGPSAIANYNTTIYGGPGTSYVVYATFLGGATATVTGKSEDGLWWAISVPVAPTGSGWVDAAWVTVANAESVPVLPTPPVPPTTELVPPGPTDPQAVAIANVYVRSGPATNYPAYGIAPAGATGWVIGKSEDSQWWVVRLNPEKVGAGYGWVMAQYTQASNVESVQTIQNPDTYASIPPAPPPSGVPAAMAVEYVNVRTGPGTNYPILGVASPGAAAEVSGKSSDGAWWQVKIPTQYAADGYGWVSADYVVTQEYGERAGGGCVDPASYSAGSTPASTHQRYGLCAGIAIASRWHSLSPGIRLLHHLGAAEHRLDQVGPKRSRCALRGRSSQYPLAPGLRRLRPGGHCPARLHVQPYRIDDRTLQHRNVR